MSIRYHIHHKDGTETGPHDAIETYLAWQAGTLGSRLAARGETDMEWLPLSAILERDGFDTASVRFPDKIPLQQALQQKEYLRQHAAAMAAPVRPAPQVIIQQPGMARVFGSCLGAAGGMFIAVLLIAALFLYACTGVLREMTKPKPKPAAAAPAN